MSNIMTLHKEDDDDDDRIHIIEEFKSRRAELSSTAEEAGITWEQALSKLYATTPLTLEEIGKIEDKSTSWVSDKARFGRFLGYCSANSALRGNNQTMFNTLAENRFTKLWLETPLRLKQEVLKRERGRTKKIELSRFEYVLKVLNNEEPECTAETRDAAAKDMRWQEQYTDYITKRPQADTIRGLNEIEQESFLATAKRLQEWVMVLIQEMEKEDV